MFCQKCKSIIISKKGEIKCANCGHQMNFNHDCKIRDIQKTTQKIEVADAKNILAVHEHKCKKCGYTHAQLIEKGVWYSDEDNVVVYKCGKCGCAEMSDAKIQ